MSATLTNLSSYSSAHMDSGNCEEEDNGRNLLRTISLNNVISFVCCFFRTTIFPNGHSQEGTDAEEGTGDVESGRGGEMPLQAAEPNINAFVVPPPPPIVVVGGGNSTQSEVADTTISGNQAFILEGGSGAGPAMYVIATLPNHQIIGHQVVGIWIVPTVIGVVSCLIQVVVGSQKINSDQKLLLYLCSGISLATAFLGIVLFLFSTMQCVNNPRRYLIARSIVVLALGSTFVDICVLITFGFIVLQSKSHE